MCARPKGSKNRPKVSPLVEERYVPSKMEAIAPVVEDLMLVKEKLEQLKQKPTILNGPVFDTGKITKRLNELTNHESLPFEETPFPEGWEKLGKIERLQWLTQHRKR